ncbi:hypothetical protein BN1708_002639 [Verticillium longisporum]|uniref:Uncharacterized protein n=2 Tax=Verticillium longisporum TaxID=100787 RepID=A0A0G4KYA3_VERLO|nr:hypothetical protein BN1708_002639 [Verticillium longisporum]
MASEQGAGGGIESNRRHLSTSTRASTDNEPTPETETQTANMKPAQQSEEDSQFTQAPQGLPRGVYPPSTTATPTPTAGLPMSRAVSSSSSNSSTPPSTSAEGYFGNAHTTRTRPALPLEPPVTKATLSELDVSKIIHNPKLRHDINFDPELHFRPNVDGDKGRRKEVKAEHFWATLQEQLIMFVMDREGFYAIHGENDDWCLPQLLRTVKDIIQTLVPVRDRVYLDEGLNVELLMQQFNKGIADLEKLASWLSRVLKSHCAPMRDEWVDRMYEKLSNGNRNNDMGELVLGMRGLLEVLEAMKLDVANHQIRCLRPVLIEDTVHFEQRFFFKRIQQRRVDVGPAREWYRDAERRYAGTISPAATQSFGETAIFFEALCRLIRPSVYEKEAPNTFVFDEERFLKLRSDMLDAVNLEVCMRLYDELERVSRTVNSLSNGFPSHLEEEPVISRTSSPFDFNFNTPPASGSRPSSLAFSSADSVTSSPRSSLVLPSQAIPTSDPNESQAKARKLYNSLVALIQTSPPTSRHESRWASMAPSLAIQIFRFTNAPSDVLPAFEAKLLAHVTDVHGSLFREVEDHFNARLLTDLQRRMREYRGLNGVALFSVATGGRGPSSSRAWDASSADGSGRDDAGVEDMATRLAHLGILHWRVWAQLAYAGEATGDFECDMQSNQI